MNLTIFAASSLTEAFTELARAFASSEGGARPTLAFAGSQVLRLQIEQGARAHVFASANPRHMEALVGAELVATPETFARNELVVIVPRDNPASVRSFDDLPRARRSVVGTPEVPVGSYTRRLLENAAAAYGPDFASTVRAHVVSEESNVRLVRAKVELGEADAAIVYRTDASGRVLTIPVPPALSVRAEYQIALVGRPPHGETAQRWIAFVRSDEGQRILSEHGFVTK